ncbi:MAG: tRNA(Met) cytidine acetyltransferase TmcA [Pseudomonadota bacterium]
MSEQPPPLAPQNRAALSAWLDAAAYGGQRATLVISGEAAWCRAQAAAVMAAFGGGDGCLWLGGEAFPPCRPLGWQQARSQLGSEAERLVVDGLEGFDAEAFGALSGTLRAGGLLLLLTPPLERWPERPDPQLARMLLHPWQPQAVAGRFIRRFVEVLRSSPDIGFWSQGGAPQLPASAPPHWSGLSEGDLYAGEEQRLAVAAVHHVAKGHAHRPLVLSADRGRGKSAALGIAAAQLLQQGLRRILVSAPRIAAAEQIFAHAAAQLPGCEAQRGRLGWQGAELVFVPPDALVQAPHRGALLLVDEAAAIPAALLERMLAAYPRVVFATTIHGYEGTGRGFALRFRQVLESRTPGWRAMQLSQPVRWAEGDPLERLAFRTLLLDAEPAAAEAVVGASVERCRVETLEAAQLLGRERDLSQLFGLLVLAHYRTSPNDLRQLLDGPQQYIHLLRFAGEIVGVALVVDEGALDGELAQQVYLGRRRVQGHLLPQSLANHAGFPEAARLAGARVMRVAIHPRLQGRGLGSLLLAEVVRAAGTRGRDYVGASFGATSDLLRFWQRQGWLPVRLGLRREASSGSHSVMVMKPLSERGERLFLQLWERFAELLPELLAGPLSALDGELADRLLSLAPTIVHESIGSQDRRDLESFAFGLRGYELCALAIRKLVLQAQGSRRAQALLDAAQRQLLRDKVLQRHDWPLVVRHGGFTGKKAAQASLREAVARLVRYYF